MDCSKSVGWAGRIHDLLTLQGRITITISTFDWKVSKNIITSNIYMAQTIMFLLEILSII